SANSGIHSRSAEAVLVVNSMQLARDAESDDPLQLAAAQGRGDVSKRYRRQDDAGADSPGGGARARVESDYAAATVVTLRTAQDANCGFMIFNLIDQPGRGGT
ncbi:MAG: hypothetical protein WA769_02635, partial [Pseudolabrys sp.]